MNTPYSSFVLNEKVKGIDDLTQKIVESKIINEIFTKDKTHAQLVQRSESVLRLLMAKEALTTGDRDLVWGASEINDGDLMVELYKVLIGAAPDMRTEDRHFFLKKIT